MLTIRTSRYRAFTLIELLVVVAILTLLAAILFPVFARARENAKRASCQSNLKQVGLGIQLYVQDFDRYYPPAPETPDGTQGWSYSLAQTYTKNDQIFQCPSELDKVYFTDYWMNGQLLGLNESQLSHPSNTILHGDGKASSVEYAVGVENSPSGCTPSINCDWEVWDRNAEFTSRHLGGANYAFADGHVKFLTPNQITLTDPAGGGNFSFKLAD